MAREDDERTLKMKEKYMKLRFEEGKTHEEIAKMFGLSSHTVRDHLSEIAAENGVKREDLLQVPHKPHVFYERQFAPIKPVDLTDFNQKFMSTIKGFNEMRVEVAKCIHGAEETQKEIKEEQDSWRVD